MIPLSKFHTFGLAASANNLIHIGHESDFARLADLCDAGPMLILGEGSNCVFVEDFAGTIAHIATQGIEASECAEGVRIEVAAGCNWHQLVMWCLKRHYHGLENLALIPGTVGAAPIQNIGAYGVEVANFIESVKCFDLETRKFVTLSGEACEFGYRDSLFKKPRAAMLVIASVTFWLSKNGQPVTSYGELKTLKDPSAADVFHHVMAIRRAKLPDPAELGNAGSFFKNPIVALDTFTALQRAWPDMPCYTVDQHRVKVPAAWLIDTLGFKGKRVGGVTCHATQPLVLTNDGTGTAEQLLILAREIRDAVKLRFDITLENEVRIIGRTGMITL